MFGSGCLKEIFLSAFDEVIGTFDGGFGVLNDGLMEFLALFLLPFLHLGSLVIFIWRIVI